MRGKNTQASKEDFRVEHERKQRLKEYENYLKKFQYKYALDAALRVRLEGDELELSQIVAFVKFRGFGRYFFAMRFFFFRISGAIFFAMG